MGRLKWYVAKTRKSARCAVQIFSGRQCRKFLGRAQAADLTALARFLSVGGYVSADGENTINRILEVIIGDEILEVIKWKYLGRGE